MTKKGFLKNLTKHTGNILLLSSFILVLFDPASPTLAIYLEEILSHMYKTGVRKMVITALFVMWGEKIETS